MPILYNQLTYKDILYHQAAYDCFDKAGRELFSDWNMIEFEKAVLGCGDDQYLFMAKKIKEIPNLFGDLDSTMPFLHFGEVGQHYGYELFLSPPSYWGSRGAPLWWAYAARKFTFDKLPIEEKTLYKKYDGIAKEFGLDMNHAGTVFVERFDAGGMSSGVVGEKFIYDGWCEIQHRNRLYQEG
jgi:hypothetical protein